MDVKDLIVGSCLQYRDKSKILRVSNIGHFFETVDQNDIPYGSDDINDYNGIKLTEDILVNNCNFKRLGRYTFYRSTFKIHKRKRGFVIRKSIPMIDYLHQLQIAYKLFTGKELQITL